MVLGLGRYDRSKNEATYTRAYSTCHFEGRVATGQPGRSRHPCSGNRSVVEDQGLRGGAGWYGLPARFVRVSRVLASLHSL